MQLMFKTLTLATLVVFTGACGGDDGSSTTVQNVDDVTQGTGPNISLDPTAGSATGKTATEAIVVAVATQAIAANDSGVDTAVNAHPEATTQVCTTGAFSTAFGPFTIKSSAGGSAEFSGDGQLRRTGDTGSQTITTDGSFSAYSVSVPALAASVTMTGDQTFSGAVEIAQGMNALCAFATGTGSTSGAISETMTERWVSALSISGAAGAAITLDVTRTTTVTGNTASDTDSAVAVAGSATVKSGDTTMACTIANTSNTGSVLTATCQ